MSIEHIKLNELPGWEIVHKGLDDLRHGDVDSIEAILVMMAMPRLRPHADLLHIPVFITPDRPLNIVLYEKLEDFGNGAHARYNALRRRLLKFCNTLDQMQKQVLSASYQS